MTQRILIMGLPGAGKTYLAQYILEHLQAANKKIGWLNADDVRKKYDDWDFSHEGRIRQSKRMRELADSMTDMDYVICDFVAPLVEMRNNFKADWTVWVDTIREGRYADTNAIFQAPEQYDFRIKEQNSEKWSEFVAHHILGNFRDNHTKNPGTKMKKYHLRFNTKHNGSDLVWRIFEDGVEHLATDVRIIGETYTECTEEHGVTKWNIACEGRMVWIEQHRAAVIVTGKD